MADACPFSLTIPSELRLLPVARLFVEAVCQSAGLDPAAVNAVVLAVNEATSNVIRHAHRDRPATPLHVKCRLLSEGIEVQIFDEGPTFDLETVPHLDPGEVRVGGTPFGRATDAHAVVLRLHGCLQTRQAADSQEQSAAAFDCRHRQ